MGFVVPKPQQDGDFPESRRNCRKLLENCGNPEIAGKIRVREIARTCGNCRKLRKLPEIAGNCRKLPEIAEKLRKLPAKLPEISAIAKTVSFNTRLDGVILYRKACGPQPLP